MQRFRHFFLCCLAAFLLPALAHAAGIPYSVEFEGFEDAAALKTIKSVSQLVSLKKRPPASINALRYRAESDIPELLKVLHAHGYYEATVDIRIEELAHTTHVLVTIIPGPLYQVESYTINLYSGARENVVECQRLDLKTIGITLGKPALASQITEAELKLLQLLADCGYPLANIEQREIVADGLSKQVCIEVDVQTGPLAYFGMTTIAGESAVKSLLIEKKINWKAGEKYQSSLVDNTQKDLMDTGLFSSALVTHAEELDEDGCLPIHIEVAESKHRSVNIGASYQTFWGFGLTFGWENRNIAGMGQRLNFQGDVTRKSHSGTANYIIPDFIRRDQNYIWQAIAAHAKYKAYSERSYSLANKLEGKLGHRFWLSVGVRGERLYVTESIDNGDFWLLEAPLYLRWSSANSLLNPTKGATCEYGAEPTLNFSYLRNNYLQQEFTQSVYTPFMESHAVVLAQKFTFGSLFSRDLNAVPLAKRFFGGSENDLRGYGYRTVSPLKEGKPEGGRSAIFYTAELRFRFTDTMGVVPFFDLGNVYTTQLPTFKHRWFKSVGVGYRYFSFIGPLRFDIGFPLDRRKGLDPKYRILVSIGQMF